MHCGGGTSAGGEALCVCMRVWWSRVFGQSGRVCVSAPPPPHTARSHPPPPQDQLNHTSRPRRPAHQCLADQVGSKSQPAFHSQDAHHSTDDDRGVDAAAGAGEAAGGGDSADSQQQDQEEQGRAERCKASVMPGHTHLLHKIHYACIVLMVGGDLDARSCQQRCASSSQLCRLLLGCRLCCRLY